MSQKLVKSVKLMIAVKLVALTAIAGIEPPFCKWIIAIGVYFFLVRIFCRYTKAPSGLYHAMRIWVHCLIFYSVFRTYDWNMFYLMSCLISYTVVLILPFSTIDVLQRLVRLPKAETYDIVQYTPMSNDKIIEAEIVDD